jgi:hypothetical protein
MKSAKVLPMTEPLRVHFSPNSSQRCIYDMKMNFCIRFETFINSLIPVEISSE